MCEKNESEYMCVLFFWGGFCKGLGEGRRKHFLKIQRGPRQRKFGNEWIRHWDSSGSTTVVSQWAKISDCSLSMDGQCDNVIVFFKRQIPEGE